MDLADGHLADHRDRRRATRILHRCRSELRNHRDDPGDRDPLKYLGVNPEVTDCHMPQPSPDAGP